MDDYDEAVLFTYSLLESRLARLAYLLSAPPAHGDAHQQTIPDRIRAIEHSLTHLAGQTALVANVTELLTKHKDVLTPPAPSSPPTPSHTPTSPPTTSPTPPLSTSQKSLIVINRATTLSTVASQLTSLSDSTVPSTDGFAQLAALRPRMAEAEQRQLQQALKIAELRRRSGLLVQRDRQVLGVAGGRAWAECQGRVVRGWRALQREEGRRGGEGDVE